jgi:hypothetical protein
MWVSSGSDTQNTERTQIGLSWFGLLSPISNSIVIFVLGMPNKGLQWWKLKEIGRGWLGDI